MVERSTDNRVIQVRFLVEPPFLNNKYKYNKMFNKFFKSSSNNVLSTGTSHLQVNGRTISVQGDLVIVDGKRIDLPETKNIEITVNGNVNTIESSIASVVVTGDVSQINNKSGDIIVNGNVSGNVNNVSGDIKVKGNVTGSAHTVSGDISKN